MAGQDPAPFAEYYRARSQATLHPGLRRLYALRAAEFLDDQARTAVRLQRSSHTARLTRANLLLGIGETNQALPDLAEAIATASPETRLTLQRRLARLHMDRGEHAEAATTLREGLAEAPDTAEHLELLAYLEYTHLKDLINALLSFQHLLALQPDHPKREEYERVIDYLLRRVGASPADANSTASPPEPRAAGQD